MFVSSRVINLIRTGAADVMYLHSFAITLAAMGKLKVQSTHDFYFCDHLDLRRFSMSYLRWLGRYLLFVTLTKNYHAFKGSWVRTILWWELSFVTLTPLFDLIMYLLLSYVSFYFIVHSYVLVTKRFYLFSVRFLVLMLL